MRKIEKLPRVGKKNLYGKIDELVDAVNRHDLFLCNQFGLVSGVNPPEQTQEPESVEPAEWKCPFCGHKECWFDRTTDENGNMGFRCDKCGRRDDEKEPECEHCFCVDCHTEKGLEDYCCKCGITKGKPAKKECEHNWGINVDTRQKDELAESFPLPLHPIDLVDARMMQNEYAKIARKWALEVVEKLDADVKQYAGSSPYTGFVSVRELLARLKELK